MKGKTFFYTVWDQNMSVTKQTVTTPVLTDAARQGIFRYFDNWNNADAHQLPPTFPAVAATATIAVVDTARQSPPGWRFHRAAKSGRHGVYRKPEVLQRVRKHQS